MSEEFDFKSKKEKKVWDSYEAYENDRFAEREERNRKITKKVKDFFVYTIGWRARDWWYNTKWYLKNIRKFLKLAKDWRPWDYHYQIDLFKFGISELANYIETKGHEVDESRLKKVASMRELITEIDRDYEEELSKKLGRNAHFGDDVQKIVEYEDGSVLFDFKEDEDTTRKNKEYYDKVAKERKKHYDKIFKIILGQDINKLNEEVNKQFSELPKEEQVDPHYTKHSKIFEELFDGTGIEGWWD